MTGKKILSSIYENTKKVLKTLVGIRATLLNIEPVTLETRSAGHCVVIRTEGLRSHVIVISFDAKTGLALASRLTKREEKGPFSEEAQSALCEMANIIIGNAMSTMDTTGTHGSLNPSTFSQGACLRSFMPGVSTAYCISLDVEVGVLRTFVSSIEM